jgi:hypothetical protein
MSVTRNFLHGFKVNLDGFTFIISEYNAARIINEKKTAFLEARYGQSDSLYVPFDQMRDCTQMQIKNKLKGYYPELFT